MALNFSGDSQIASIQRDEYSVDFVLLEQKISTSYLTELKQLSKKNSKLQRIPLIGHQWVSDKHVVFITGEWVDLYVVSVRKKTIKCQLLKSQVVTANWFTYVRLHTERLWWTIIVLFSHPRR
jgi:hypothetical protein